MSEWRKHHRRSIRLAHTDYSVPGFYSVTMCVKNREHLFGEIIEGEIKFSKIGEAARNCWLEIPNHFPDAVLDEFVIMPNHVHGVIEIVDRTVGVQNFEPLHTVTNRYQHIVPRSLGSIVRGYKIGVTKLCRQNDFYDPIWQRNYYEHIIRNQAALNRIRQYIRDNPWNWETDVENTAYRDKYPRSEFEKLLRAHYQNLL